ncbi:MAG: hypothetical protein N2439_02300, partial [Anaerolineae bacterium]|nr:hypothetical protein [Anaerolineae bacterium]
NQNSYALTILSGGLLDALWAANIDSLIYNGFLTAGTNGSPSELIVSRFWPANVLYLRSIITDNGYSSPLTFTKGGAGFVGLDWTSNNFSGGTIVAGGILYVGPDNSSRQSPWAFGSGSVTVQAGAQLRLGGHAPSSAMKGLDIPTANDLVLNGGYMVTLGGNQHWTGNVILSGMTNSTLAPTYSLNDLWIEGVISGSSGLRIITNAVGGAAGAVILTNANTFAGGVNIDGGYLFLGLTNSMGTGQIIATNANTSTTASPGGIGSVGPLDQTFVDFVALRAASPITAHLMLLTNSSNPLNLGDPMLAQSYLAASPARIVTYDGALTPGAATYRLSGAANSGTLIFGGLLTGTNNLTIGNIGKVILTNNNDYSGWTYITNGGTLVIGTNAPYGSIGLGVVTNLGSLVFGRSDAVTVSNFIAGSGSLYKEGVGPLTLINTN